MKKTLLVIFSAIFFLNVSGQTKMNFSLYKKANDATRQSNEIAIFVKGDIEKIKSETERLGGVFKYSAGDIAAVRIPVSSVQELASKNFVTRIEDNNLKLKKLNDTLLINNNVWPAFMGISPLTQGYDGSGVVIGVIDEGIDLVHEDFKDVNGNTRIKFLWDQTISNDPGGITPMPYGYGTEWNSTAINNGSASAHQDGIYGHGSMVTGIAAGNGLAVNNYRGVAPGADIISVKLDLNVPDDVFLASIADAAHYIYSKAQAMGEPAVINVSLGTYFGSHDGQDLQAQIIGNLISAQPGRSFVCAAGNAGYNKFHVGYNVPPDTAFTWLDPSGSPTYAYIGLYGDTADMNSIQFAAGADDNNNYSYRGGTTFSNLAGLMGLQTTNIMNGPNRIGIVQSYGDTIGSTFSLEYYIQPDSLQYMWRIMTKGSGRVDAWSFNIISDNLPLPGVFPLITKYQPGDTMQNIVSSFTCRDEVITVGSYTNRSIYSDVHNIIHFDTTITPGEISRFSSHGPTRDGRIKPDIISSGGNVISTGYQPRINVLLNTSWDFVVAAGGRHMIDGGTSLSSPAVVGIAALYYQQNPTADWSQVKNAILNCAKRDAFTGTNLPNPFWGYGKADAFATLTGCATGVNNISVSSGDMIIAPNPAEIQTAVYYSVPLQNSTRKCFIRVRDVLGKNQAEIPLQSLSGHVLLPVEKLSGGIYFCSLVAGDTVLETKKLLVK